MTARTSRLLPPAGRGVPGPPLRGVLLRDGHRDVGKTVDEIPQLLDLGVRQPVVVTEDLAASRYGQHPTSRFSSVNDC
ncbi:MAG: hypothetical protein R2862_12860 [Thermoanaerobaculia bacterium]